MRQVDISNYLPKVISDTSEFQSISASENQQINNLWASHEDVFNNQFINSLDETGCLRWENILNITPMGTDSLEDRRFRIAAYINADIPYTYRQLENMIENLCGSNGYTMELNNNDYKLIVRIAISVSKQFSEVEKLLKRVVPANILIDLELLYNQYKNYKSKTYGQLSAYKHKQLREDVIN